MGKRKARKPGVAIRAYLEKNRLSQKNFAERLDVSQSLVAQWITGRARPTPKKAPDIIKITGGEVTREDLFPELYFP